MKERYAYNEYETGNILASVHEMLSTITNETVFVPWDDSIRPFDRAKDVECALKLEARVRAQFPQEAHVYGLTVAKAQYHLETFDMKKDPRTAAEIYGLLQVARCAFDGHTSGMLDAETLHSLFPLTHYHIPELENLPDFPDMIKNLAAEYDWAPNVMQEAAMHLAITLGRDQIAGELLDMSRESLHSLYVYEIARIQRARMQHNMDELTTLKRRNIRLSISTGYELFSTCLSVIRDAQMEHAMASGNMSALTTLLYEQGPGDRAMWSALSALKFGRRNRSMYIPDIIHECQTILGTLIVDHAPPQDYDVRKTYFDERPEIVTSLTYLHILEEFMIQLAYIDPKHPVIDTCIWGNRSYIGFASFHGTSEELLHADTILRALARSQRFQEAEDLYDRLYEAHGEIYLKTATEVYFEFVKNRETQALGDSVIEYSEQFLDRPAAFKSTMYDILIGKIRDRFHECDLEVLINTMERVDLQASAHWKQFVETDEEVNYSHPIGRDYLGRKPNRFQAQTPELMAEIAGRLLDDGDMPGFRAVISDSRLSPAMAGEILDHVSEALYGESTDVYYHNA